MAGEKAETSRPTSGGSFCPASEQRSEQLFEDVPGRHRLKLAQGVHEERAHQASRSARGARGEESRGKTSARKRYVEREGILNLSAARAQDQKAPTSIKATRPAWGFLWVFAALVSPRKPWKMTPVVTPF